MSLLKITTNPTLFIIQLKLNVNPNNMINTKTTKDINNRKHIIIFFFVPAIGVFAIQVIIVTLCIQKTTKTKQSKIK